MLGDRGRPCKWGGLLALALSLLILYAATAGSTQSAGRMASTTLTFEALGPASWPDLLRAGCVLQGRLRAAYPDAETLPAGAQSRPLQYTAVAGWLVVTLPPEVPAQWLVTEAARIGSVEMVEGGTEFLPLGRHVETGPLPRPELGVYEAVLTQAHFVAADAHLRRGQPVIEVVLSPEGDARLSAHTARQHGYYLCLLVDGEVVNCPIVRTPLADRHGFIELTGAATLQQARALAGLLRSGPLPVALRPIGWPGD